MMITIEKISNFNEDSLQLIQAPMTELTKDTGPIKFLDMDKLRKDMTVYPDNLIQLVVKSDNKVAGIVTLQESFAFYADGKYGIINELYVLPGFRSKGMGRLLLDEVKKTGRAKGWHPIDVTAPPGQ